MNEIYGLVDDDIVSLNGKAIIMHCFKKRITPNENFWEISYLLNRFE